MKEDIIEYHPNGKLKHKICFWENGNKRREDYYNENGLYHRIDGPAYQVWHENGMLSYADFQINNIFHNKNNPTRIWYDKTGKKQFCQYWINNRLYSRLEWLNQIKKI